MSSRKRPPAKTPVPKLRRRGAVVFSRYTDACFTVHAVGDGNDREGAAARANYTRARNALIRYIATLEAALLDIASLSEGRVVTSGFDCPVHATNARIALGLNTPADIDKELTRK